MVSIQLISPASGDEVVSVWIALTRLRFHSTDFPSEWGRRAAALATVEIVLK